MDNNKKVLIFGIVTAMAGIIEIYLWKTGTANKWGFLVGAGLCFASVLSFISVWRRNDR